MEAKQTCDEKCQKRAQMWEVVAVSVVLVVALISGKMDRGDTLTEARPGERPGFLRGSLRHEQRPRGAGHASPGREGGRKARGDLPSLALSLRHTL